MIDFIIIYYLKIFIIVFNSFLPRDSLIPFSSKKKILVMTNWFQWQPQKKTKSIIIYFFWRRKRFPLLNGFFLFFFVFFLFYYSSAYLFMVSQKISISIYNCPSQILDRSNWKKVKFFDQLRNEAKSYKSKIFFWSTPKKLSF